MKKLILPALAVATLSFTSCGGGSSELENALSDLESLTENLDNLGETTEEIMDNAEDLASTDVFGDAFVSEDGNYSINFPGTPEVTNESVPTAAGNIEMTMAMYEKSATEVYMSSFNDYPSAIVEGQDPYQMLEGALGGATGSMGVTIEDEKRQEEYQGYPSIYYKGHAASGYHATYRVLLKGNRLYQVGALRDGSHITPEMEESFLGSFQLTE